MQGFNRYYPPDYDPNKNATLNSVHGKHALGVRARKIDQGILITRFEMPFNIWCGGCDAHIGQGVRFNAEKKKIGNYYSTPIYSFRCKCHVCAKQWFTIETDPKNTRYVVTEGARQKHEEWDPAEAGQFVLDQKDPNAPPDPLASVEKAVVDKQKAETDATRIEAMKALQEDRWSDPYELSKKLRTSFRADKKERKIRDEGDDVVRQSYGLPSDLLLEDVTVEQQDEARALWQQQQARRIEGGSEERHKRRRMEAELGLPSGSQTPSLKKAKVKLNSSSPERKQKSAVQSLSNKLLLSAKHKQDPFLNGSSSSSGSSLGIRRKGPS